MKIYANGIPLEILGKQGPIGRSGPDGNPIGTVISYMGRSAPDGYLICDGTEYNIAYYSQLADFFKEQFGTSNYFGGDGETTFAVPDLRNLFLRGYHGDIEEELSGEIGEKQEATQIPNVMLGKNNSGLVTLSGPASLDKSTQPENIDSGYEAQSAVYGAQAGNNMSSLVDPPFYRSYTSRPVNAAVLFCIKAITSETVEDVYSLEEKRVGTWIDGKPLYRRVLLTESLATQGTIGRLQDKETPILIEGYLIDSVGAFYNANTYSTLQIEKDNTIWYNPNGSYRDNRPIIIFLMYTKEDDEPTA